MSVYGYKNSCLEVNLDTIRDNIAKIKRHIGPERGMIGVVKGNGYGLGVVPVARLLVEECGFDILAVAHVCEGIELRDAFVSRDTDILVMSAFSDEAIPALVEYGLAPTVFTPETAAKLEAEAAKQGKRVKVHIKIETGMNRLGARPGEELDALAKSLKAAERLEVGGVCTHFATAKDYSDPFALAQLGRFKEGAAQLAAAGIAPPVVHTANTGATIWFKEAYGTHVRCAGLFLGYSKMNDRSNPVGVVEAASWRAVVTHVRTVMPGESVGYSRFFKPERPSRVAVIGVGYVDGLHRDVAMNGGPLLIRGHKARYAGVCMDQCFADVTDIPCEVGDIATLIGGDGDMYVSPFDLMDCAPVNTCASFFTSLSDRVARSYIHTRP
ncbi:alanine racemase [Deltaproteobacteria bacterium]|nr:alanine racemase [Deltaproteobacteria bacterium]